MYDGIVRMVAWGSFYYTQGSVPMPWVPLRRSCWLSAHSVRWLFGTHSADAMLRSGELFRTLQWSPTLLGVFGKVGSIHSVVGILMDVPSVDLRKYCGAYRVRLWYRAPQQTGECDFSCQDGHRQGISCYRLARQETLFERRILDSSASDLRNMSISLDRICYWSQGILHLLCLDNSRYHFLVER